MDQLPTNGEIAKFFAGKAAKAGFVDRLKIRYRPYICPYRPLLGLVAGHFRLIDIGCGSGQFCLLAARFSCLERIHGIEIDQRLVDNAYAALAETAIPTAEVTFSVFNGRDIPTDVCEYDLISMIDVLHHIPRITQRPFLERVHAAMRPGTTLVLKDIDADSPFVVANRLHDVVFSGSPGWEWGHADARKVCQSIGFHVADSFTQRAGFYPHYFLRLVKV